MNDLEAFAKLVQALDPWRGQLVFIGGWSHRLHTLHPNASQLAFQPIFTKDTDLAFHHKVPLEGSIKNALIEKGFREDLSGEARPPAAHYKLGSDIKRTGEPDATMLAGDISAQKIRHLELLLTDPWRVTVGPMNGVPLQEAMDLQVANPLCFMVQKFLIKEQRKADKHRQDLLYVFDTIQLFGHMIPQFKENWERVIAPSLDAGAVNTVKQQCGESFKTVTDSIRDAASIPQDRRVDPEQFRATCQYAFQQILGL